MGGGKAILSPCRAQKACARQDIVGEEEEGKCLPSARPALSMGVCEWVSLVREESDSSSNRDSCSDYVQDDFPPTNSLTGAAQINGTSVQSDF